MIVVVLAALGLVFGSFVNALVWRLKTKRNFWTERSECPYCHHVLAGKDLVPVLSWLSLGGKCRYCKHKIEDSPLTELALPVLFAGSYLLWPEALHGVGLFEFICWLVFLVGFLALAVYDFRWFLLPDKLVLPLTLLALAQVSVAAVWRHDVPSLIWNVVGGLIIGGLFYVLYQLSKGEWIGGGDVKLGFVLGVLAMTPLRAMLVLFLASVAGVLASLPLVIAGKAGHKTKIPFGPFLILGLVLTQLFGGHIMDWYAGLFAA